MTPPAEYFPKLLEICRSNGFLFIADESKGYGPHGPDVRQGALECKSRYGHGRQEPGCRDALECRGGQGGMYGFSSCRRPGGGPTATTPWGSAALAVMDVFEQEDLVDKAAVLGRKLRSHFDLTRC